MDCKNRCYRDRIACCKSRKRLNYEDMEVSSGLINMSREEIPGMILASATFPIDQTWAILRKPHKECFSRLTNRHLVSALLLQASEIAAAHFEISAESFAVFERKLRHRGVGQKHWWWTSCSWRSLCWWNWYIWLYADLALGQWRRRSTPRGREAELQRINVQSILNPFSLLSWFWACWE